MALSRLVATAVLLPGFLQPVLAQDDESDESEAVFTFPSEDQDRLEFHDNAEVIVAFECPKDTVDLRIYCNDENMDDYIHEVTVFEGVSCADQEYSFRVDFDYYSSSCWFNMRDNDGSDEIEINSAEFAISRTPADATFGPSEPTASVTTSSLPSSTASSDDASSTTETNASETTTADPSPSSSDGDGGLSTGAKAGIGVGVALGVIGIAALAGAFWMVRRKRGGNGGSDGSAGERQELYAEPAGPKQPGYQMQEYNGSDGVKSANEGPPRELADTRRTQYELP